MRQTILPTLAWMSLCLTVVVATSWKEGTSGERYELPPTANHVTPQTQPLVHQHLHALSEHHPQHTPPDSLYDYI